MKIQMIKNIGTLVVVFTFLVGCGNLNQKRVQQKVKYASDN